MTGHNKQLVDVRMQRVVNLLGQYGLRAGDCAQLLRNLAEWYQPHGMRACAVCGELFKPKRRSKRYCSRACKQAEFRENKKLA